MHVHVNGRTYKRVSLDEDTTERINDLDRLMRDRPTPLREARLVRRTGNGNLITAVAR